APSDSIHRLDANAACVRWIAFQFGLTNCEAVIRVHEFGRSAQARTRTRGPSAVVQVLAPFTNFFGVILWVAARPRRFVETSRSVPILCVAFRWAPSQLIIGERWLVHDCARI